MLESTDRTSTRSDSAAAAEAIGGGRSLHLRLTLAAPSQQAHVDRTTCTMPLPTPASLAVHALAVPRQLVYLSSVTMKDADGSRAKHSPRTLQFRSGRAGRPAPIDRVFTVDGWAEPMLREMKEKLSRGDRAAQLRTERDAAAGDCDRGRDGRPRENSEYKAALERQQFVQARLGQLHQRMQQVTQLANHEAPTDRVGLGSKVKGARPRAPTRSRSSWSCSPR